MRIMTFGSEFVNEGSGVGLKVSERIGEFWKDLAKVHGGR